MLEHLCTDVFEQAAMAPWNHRACTWGCRGWEPPPRSECVQDMLRDFKEELGSVSRLEWTGSMCFK